MPDGLRSPSGQRLCVRRRHGARPRSSTRPSARLATRAWRCTAAVALATRSSARSATTRAWAGSGSRMASPSDFGPLALGAFIHNLHASNVVPFGAITYPQSLARCAGCHVDGKVYGARTSALPITVDAGTTLDRAAPRPAVRAWKDDLADSATAGTCKGCQRPSGPPARRPHAVAGWQLRRCQGAGAFVVRGRLRGLPRRRARPSTPRSCTATRCLTASAPTDRPESRRPHERPANLECR